MSNFLSQGLFLSMRPCFDTIERLYPYAEKATLISPQYLEQAYGYKHSHVFLAALLACYPLGFIMHLLPYGKIRHLFSFVMGAILLQVTWGANWIHTPITSLISYALLRVCHQYQQTHKRAQKNFFQVQIVVPVFVMTYLGFCHFQHQYSVENVLGMDIYFTCSQMILTQKLYMLAYNLHDGYTLSEYNTDNKDDNKLDKSNNSSALRAAKKCSEFALAKFPSLLEFLGYTFCFSTCLVGPSFEFSHYLSACDGSLHYITIAEKDGTKAKRLRGKSIPSNLLPTLLPLLKCIGLIFFASIFDRYCNYRRLVTPWFFELTAKQRFFYNWITNFIQRLKVYFTWSFAEGANNLWYAGFDGYDRETGQAKGFTTACGAEIWNVETCESIRQGTKAWNKKTSQWLLRYVYIRNKSRLGIVYAVSAIWHGFYPGYYMLASMVWLISQCERLGRAKISPYFSEKKWSLYSIACMLSIHSVGGCYATTAFFLRSWENVMDNWRAHHFCGHIVCVVFYLAVSQLPTPQLKQKHLGTTLIHEKKRDTNVPALQSETSSQGTHDLDMLKLERKHS